MWRTRRFSMNFLCIFYGKLGRSKLMESPKLIGILKFVCQMGISDILCRCAGFKIPSINFKSRELCIEFPHTNFPYFLIAHFLLCFTFTVLPVGLTMTSNFHLSRTNTEWQREKHFLLKLAILKWIRVKSRTLLKSLLKLKFLLSST